MLYRLVKSSGRCSLLLLVFVMMLSFVTSCIGNRHTPDVEELAMQDSIDSDADTLLLFEEKEEPSVRVDELFDDFFFTFASNPRFQCQRIKFPLVCHDIDADMEITREDWQQFSRFTSQASFSVIYERDEDMEVQKDTTLTQVSVEWVYLKDGYVESYNFSRLQGKWMLVDITKSSIDNIPNGRFLQFYSTFVSDSIDNEPYVKTPLKMHFTYSTPEEAEPEAMMSLSEWNEMKKDLPFDEDFIVTINYGQPCISQNRKNLLLEGAGNDLLMTFKFMREGDRWILFEIEN